MDGGRMNLVAADGIFNDDSIPAIGIEIGRLESEKIGEIKRDGMTKFHLLSWISRKLLRRQFESVWSGWNPQNRGSVPELWNM